MENKDTNSVDYGKCPYHAQLQAEGHSSDADEKNTSEDQDANTGDWDDQRDDAGTDPDRYEGGNNNSGGAGSTGSAATNS